MTQIFNNAGLTHETVDTDKVGGSMGYNVKTGEFGFFVFVIQIPYFLQT